MTPPAQVPPFAPSASPEAVGSKISTVPWISKFKSLFQNLSKVASPTIFADEILTVQTPVSIFLGILSDLEGSFGSLLSRKSSFPGQDIFESKSHLGETRPSR